MIKRPIMTKDALKDIIDQLKFLNTKEQEIYDIGIEISSITSKWYKITTLLLNNIFSVGQVDFIICYVYDDLTEYEEFKDIDTYDKFYDYLINLKDEEYNETENQETAN